MSDNFSANAELGFDVNDFVSSGKQVEEILERLEDVSLIFSEAVEKNAAVLAKMGETAKRAASETKSSNDKLVSDEREAYRLRKLYDEDFRREQRDSLRLQAMYEAEADAKTMNAAKERTAFEKAQRDEELRVMRLSMQQKARMADEAAKEEAAAARAAQATYKREQANLSRAHAEAIRENLRREKAAQAERKKIISDGKMLDAAYKQNDAFDQRKYNQEQANLSRSRYALYDVSTVFTAVSAAALGAVGAIQAVGVAYERDFASVARTSGLTVQSDIDNLRASLVDLSKNIPVDFASITAIGTLAGQLGVASEDIAGFTEVVAMFSASTNVSVEKSAEDIGRVAQLTQTAGEEYENLASSIYQVGVTTVATESAILETATNIATAGNLAGFTAAQIVALSGAFASLGVAPERARGSVQRIFGEMTEAVSSGGKDLAAFAAVSNMTAADFAATWKGDPQTAFNAFVQGLGAAHSAGEDTNRMLKELGINAVRDIQALQVLANNFEIYAGAQEDANSAYISGTALAEGYAITAETTAAKIQVLANQFKALFDAASNSEALGFAVEMLSDVVTLTDALLSNPVGKFFVTLAGTITLAVGGFALYSAAVARATASAYANRTAMETMRNSEVKVQQGLRGMVTEMVKMTQVLRGLDLSAQKTAAGLERVGASAQAGAAQVATANAALQTTATTGGAVATSGSIVSRTLTGVGAAARTAGAGLATLAKAYIPLGIAVTAVQALSWGIQAYSRATETAGDRATRVFGDLSSLAAAVKKDTEEWEKHNAQIAAGEKVTNEAAAAYKTVTVEVTEQSRALTDTAKAIGQSLDVTIQQTDKTSELTQKTKDQTFALGENAKAWLYNQYTTGENLDTMMNYIKRLGEFSDISDGFDIGEMLAASLDPANGGASAYIDPYITKFAELRDAAEEAADKARYAVQGGDATMGPELDRQNEIYGRYDALVGVLAELRTTAGDADSAFSNFGDTMEAKRAIAAATGLTIDEAGNLISEAADDVTKFSDSFNSLTAALTTTAAVEKALYGLGQSVYENGVYFDVYSEQGRANFEALGRTISAMSEQAGSDTDAFVQNLVLMLGELDGMGVQTGAELGYVYDMVQELALPADLGLDSSVARADIRSFIEAAIAALETRAQLERETARASATGISPSASAEQWKAYNAQIENAGKVSADQADALRGLLTQLDAQQKQTQRTGSATGGYADALNKAKAANDKATKSAKDNKKAVEDQAKAVRTYADYASDLANVLDRSFELQFGRRIAADDVLDSRDAVAAVFKAQNDYIQEQRDLIADTKQAVLEYDASINKLKADIQGMRASNKILEYQLGIARKYGNALAEQSILAEIAANNAKIGESDAEIAGIEKDKANAQKTSEQAAKDLTKALKDLNSGLSGSSKFSRDLRDATYDLIRAQNAEIVQMAKNGASQEALRNKARQHRTAIKELGDQYGLSQRSIQPFIDAVNNSIRTVNTVPRDVTVTLRYRKDGSVDTVGTAYRELRAKTVTASVTAKKTSDLDKVKKTYDGLRNKKVSVDVNTNDSGLKKAARGAALYAKIQSATAELGSSHYMQYPERGAGLRKNINTWTDQLKSGKYWTGGFTGRGDKYEPKGTVHGGEFVIPKQHVNQNTGLPNLSALGFMFKSMSMPAKTGNNNAPATNPVQLVEILPNQLNAIVEASKVLVNLDLNSLANGINAINQQSSVRGSS